MNLRNASGFKYGACVTLGVLVEVRLELAEGVAFSPSLEPITFEADPSAGGALSRFFAPTCHGLSGAGPVGFTCSTFGSPLRDRGGSGPSSPAERDHLAGHPPGNRGCIIPHRPLERTQLQGS